MTIFTYCTGCTQLSSMHTARTQGNIDRRPCPKSHPRCQHSWA